MLIKMGIHRQLLTLHLAWIDSVEFPIPSITLSDSASSPLLSQPPRAVPPQHHFDSTKPSNKASSSNPKPVPQPPKLNRRMSKDGYQSESDDESTALQPAPSSGLFGREPNRGRKWDHARQGDPVIMQSHFAGANKYTRPSTAPNRQARYSDGIEDAAGASEWSTFVKSSMYGPVRGEQNERVQPSYLDELTPGYSQPWVGDRVGASQDPEKALGLLRGSKKKRLVWYQRAQRSILTHPLVPLAFRLTVLATSTIALGLSASIFVLTRQTQFAQTPSAVMAIIVDVIALPYIGYITWDEYTGKPLGLRPPKAKMRLVLLDLFFIIFESANLSLAFQAITDTDGSCVRGEGARGEIDGNLCGQEKALAGILFVALVAWGSTFAVSIVRLVQRVGGREEGD